MSDVKTSNIVGTIDLIRALDDRMAKVEQHLNLPSANMPGVVWHPPAPVHSATVNAAPSAAQWHPEPPKPKLHTGSETWTPKSH
jgi:hypothetical protein